MILAETDTQCEYDEDAAHGTVKEAALWHISHTDSPQQPACVSPSYVHDVDTEPTQHMKHYE